MVKAQSKEVKEAEVVKEAEAEVVVAKAEAPEVKAPAKKVRKDLDRNMMVECRSVYSGTLTYVSKKTLGETTWNGFGETEYVDLGELLTMKGTQASFLNNPWIIIDDEDVVEYLGLKSIYDRILAPEDVQGLFYKTPQEIEETIAKAPKGTRELIADTARDLIVNEQLFDVRIMKVLNKALNIDLFMVQE